MVTSTNGSLAPTPSRWLALALLALTASTSAIGCAADVGEESSDDVGANVVGSTNPNRLLDVPYYFAVPKSAVDVELDRAKYTYSTVWQPSLQVKDAGLRILAVRQAGTTPAAKKAARLDMAQQLAKAGVLQDGDVALSFRPELAGTMAYPHIQMGTTHASLVYVKGGKAYNVDSPLDGEYVGQFDTKHFIGGRNSDGTTDYGTDALQIVRPRGFTAERRAQLNTWATLVAQNRANGHVRFQKDYLAPIFATTGMTTKQTVTELGRIILGASTKDLPMYCSEFAWHMLALSGCTAEQIEAAGPEGAACVAPVFTPMPLVATTSSETGLAEGPLLSLGMAPPADRAGLVDVIFAGGNAGKLSSGHRAVAEQVAPLMAGLSGWYKARAGGATAEQAASAGKQLNAGVQNVPNYSPTAFLVNAMQADGVRKLDYVATVVFFDKLTDVEKAKRLAMPKGTSIPQ
jgi:hypothetical protein